MSRASLRVLVVLTILSTAGAARAECCDGCAEAVIDAQPPLCPRSEAPALASVRRLLIVGAVAGVAGYVVGNVTAHAEPRALFAEDGIPVAGPILSAVRNRGDATAVSLLGLAATVQAMSLLAIAAAALELADRHRRLPAITVDAGAHGGGVSVSWRLP